MNTPCTTTRRRVRSALYIQAQLRRAAYETVRSSRRHTTGREHPSPRRAQGQIADRCHPDLPSASREEPAMEMWKSQRTRFPHSHSPNLILNEHTRRGGAERIELLTRYSSRLFSFRAPSPGLLSLDMYPAFQLFALPAA